MFIGFAMMVSSCNRASHTNQSVAMEDDRPPVECTDADRTFSVVLEITSDSLMTCNNNITGKDENPLILDTSNPEFPHLFSDWFASMDSIQITRLKSGSELHISVRNGVTDATVEKVKSIIKKCGIEGMSISNF